MAHTHEVNANFTQSKLEKHEWEYIEVPVSEAEKTILTNIKQGFNNPSLSVARIQSLLSYLKIEQGTKQTDLHTFIATHYFSDVISKITTLYRFVLKYVVYEGACFNEFVELLNAHGMKVVSGNDEMNDVYTVAKNNDAKMKEMKKKDKMRVENTMTLIHKSDEKTTESIYEYILLYQLVNLLCFSFTKTLFKKDIGYDGIYCDDDFYNKLMKNVCKKIKHDKEASVFVARDEFLENTLDRMYALSTLLDTSKNKINYANPIVMALVGNAVKTLVSCVSKSQALMNSHLWIENNTLLNSLRPFSLYQHQRDIISIFKQKGNHFVYYCAPTGTGKTLTPLALAQRYKIIFVCAARHVGMSFAKNAISSGYKIALAFNCGDAEDIRLHYSAAKVYKKNYKSGGIFKVDNTIGDNVEIIISDVKSYKYASYYMKAFNDVNTIITFWDEPTISMDYENHELHSFIRENWENNIIPNMVLSSATLPKESDIRNVAQGFCDKFGASMHYIKTHDFRKSICVYDGNSRIFSPHMFFKKFKFTISYHDAKSIIETFKNDKTLFRYLHIPSCVSFLLWFNDECHPLEFMNDHAYGATMWYELTQERVKEYYIDVFYELMNEEYYDLLMVSSLSYHKYYESTYNFLRDDAYTLTNGATIYLTNNIDATREKFIKEIKIPSKCIDYLNMVYEFNEAIRVKIAEIKKDFMDKYKKTTTKEKDDETDPFLVSKEASEIRALESQFKRMQLPQALIPNSFEHLNKYHSSGVSHLYPSHYKEHFKPFSSTLSERDIEKVITLKDVEQSTQFLLLCGIGIVCSSMTNEYNALISEFATRQKLFMVIASSDYIFGTNYLFHHAYIDDTIEENTRQKIIQAMGRVGRGQYNQHYSVRIKSDAIISMLFNEKYDSCIETQNMNRLLVFPTNNDVNVDALENTRVCCESDDANVEEWLVDEDDDDDVDGECLDSQEHFVYERNEPIINTIESNEELESWEDLY